MIKDFISDYEYSRLGYRIGGLVTDYGRVYIVTEMIPLIFSKERCIVAEVTAYDIVNQEFITQTNAFNFRPYAENAFKR